MEVGPTTHYMMGGVKVDADSQMSDVAGLFAAGECAAGLHEANRLGGNSLSDLLVFGKRAGGVRRGLCKRELAGRGEKRDELGFKNGRYRPGQRYAVQHTLQDVT